MAYQVLLPKKPRGTMRQPLLDNARSFRLVHDSSQRLGIECRQRTAWSVREGRWRDWRVPAPTIGSAPDEATGTTEAAIEDRETAKAERRGIQGKLSRAAR